MGQVRRGWALLPLAVVLALVAGPAPARATGATADAGPPTTCGDVAVQPGQAHCFSAITFPTSGSGVRPLAAGSAPPGWSPQDIAAMYDLPPIPATVPLGTGATVALVEAEHTSGLASDLAVYRTRFGLGACGAGCLRIVNQDGGSTPPSTDASTDGWDWETAMDVEAVSAACPACRVLVVEADSSDSTDLDAATETAAEQADYVSMSWGSDDLGASAADFASTEKVFARHPDVTFVASSGDFGWSTQVRAERCGPCTSYPASSPHVVAAGGTVADETVSAAGQIGWGQQVWGDQDTGPVTSATLNSGGSSSGCSGWTTMTAAQATDAHAVAACGTARGTADLSALADGFAMYHAAGGYTWVTGGGTSLAAPLLAAMYARAGNHTSPFDIYARAHDPATAAELTDVTGGTPTRGCPTTDSRHLCSAGPGWDGPTGLGTPHGLASLQSLQDPTPIDAPVQALLSPITADGPGTASTAPTTSVPSTAALPGIAHAGAVKVKGKAHPHRRLRAAYGSFGAGTSVTVTWLVDGRAAAHGVHLRVRKGWLHHRIRYVVTARAAGHSPLTLRSPTLRVTG